jgi:uncharacterized protein
MDITPKINPKKNIIDSYGDKGIEIKEKFYSNAIIIDVDNINEIEISSFEDFLKQDVTKYINEQDEILVIGTGSSHKIININIKNKIKAQFKNISISEMSSDSACRTYNILAFEQRDVKAIILPF